MPSVIMGGGGGGEITDSSWVSDSHTWIYDSADAPSFVVSVNEDMTDVLSPGMRVKLTQTTAKYFIVTKVGTFGGGATLVTLYGGTDYTLVNAAITSPSYSSVKAPVGFPLDPAKWTVELTHAGTQSLGDGISGNTFVRAGGTGNADLDLIVPIGAWRVGYQHHVSLNGNTGSKALYFSLSTDDESVTHPKLTSYQISDVGTVAFTQQISREQFLSLSAKTQFYIIAAGDDFSAHAMDNDGTASGVTYAVCAYL